MRTCNHHPLWHNQPLRLTEKERRDPLLVIKEFFECFHLNDTRELLWNWLVEVVSSANSISSDALERSNHFYFYEKIEELIEACYMLKKMPQLILKKEEAEEEEEIPDQRA
jgi:hypothetical protein